MFGLFILVCISLFFGFFFLMIRLPPRSTRTDTLFPYTTLFRSDEAADGGAALAKLRETSYGLVISDWNMEPMTGLQLLKEVRADSNLKSLPFIMVTAESKTENIIDAKKARVNNYNRRPMNAATTTKTSERGMGTQ